MKKLIALLLVLFFTHNIRSQSFYKGALVIDANAGIEIYNTVLKVHNKTNGRDTTQDDKAGCSTFNFGAEYGVTKKFGAGLRFRTNKYFTEKDTITGKKDDVRSIDIVAEANYHIVSKKSFDFLVGADIGYSKINWKINDTKNTRIWASGLYYDLYLNPRLYIGPFGFNFKLGLPFTTYPNLKSDNSDFTKDNSYKLKGIPGVSWSFGIQFRFLKSQD